MSTFKKNEMPFLVKKQIYVANSRFVDNKYNNSKIKNGRYY